jgi:hypothetical protein
VSEDQAHPGIPKTRGAKGLQHGYADDEPRRCGCEEHRAIFQALARRERSKAVRAMSSHLSLVETRLKPLARAEAAPSLENVLANAIEIFRGAREQAN